MNRRVFEGRLADELADGDRAYAQRLKAAARALIVVIREGLVRDGVVRLHGFGTFRLRPTRARTGINPGTGERIAIPARHRVLFRPAKALRERVEPDRPPAVPLREPHASREATLGTGTHEITRGSGTVPAAPVHAHGRHDVASGDDAPDAQPTAASGSREAALGGTMRDVHAAGGLPPGDDQEEAVSGPPPMPRGRDGRPSVAAAAIAERSLRVVDRGESPDAPAGSRAPDRRPDAPVATPVERVATPAPRDPALAPDESGAPEDTESGRRSDAARWGVAIGLVLLLALLAWWLWPTPRPVARVAQVPEPTTGSVGSRADEAAPSADRARPAAGTRQAPAAAPGDTRADARAGAAGTTVADAGTAAGDRAGTGSSSASAGGAGGDAAAPRASSESATGAPAVVADAGGDTTASAAAPAARPGTRADGANGTARTPGQDRAAGEAGAGNAQVADAGASAAAATGGGQVEPGAGVQPRADESTGHAAASGTAQAGTGAPFFRGRSYTVHRGDTLWDLAGRNYVNPYYWPHIWNSNTGIRNPDRLSVDEHLWLPALQGSPRHLTTADRRSIAEGYLRLYRFFRREGDANPQYALVGVRYFDPSVLPDELRNTAAGRPRDALAAAFEAQLRARFPYPD